MLHDDGDGFSLNLGYQGARVIHVPGDASHMSNNDSFPHPLLGSSGSLLRVLQLLVLTVVPHLGKALVHQLDGHVLSGLRVVACSADQENTALAEMKKEMLLGKQQVEHKLDHTFVI